MADHDNSYKLLFSHAPMVEDLLRGFVKEAWVEQLDFSSLEKVSGSFVADDLRDREDDIIWRVRWGQEWLYVYLLLEFQSTVDPFMAVRIMTYLGLLYQDLVRSGRLTEQGRLPPVLPVVLYNGQRRWTAAQDIAELMETVPGGLERYRPQLRYLLLDEGRYSEAELAPLQNLVAGLFRLENSQAPEDIQRVLETLVDWLQAPEQRGLRRAFTVWLRRVFLPGRLPGVEITEVQDLQEVRAMLAERVVEWTREWEQKGLERGLEKGLERGLEKGLERGRKEGELAVVLRLLERKFGPLEAGVRERLDAADPDTLLEWGERVLTASRLEDVFGNA